MPPRLSRSRVPNAVSTNVRSKTKKRSLDAYATAAKNIKEKRIPQHRLGEDLVDEPRYKRQRTGKHEGEGSEDEDEFQQSRDKRRAERSIAHADDDVQHGNDSSGNEWTVGGLGEDDDDSELDSDEAFGDSDEERFEGFTFRGSSSNRLQSKKTRSNVINDRKRQVDLDEESQDEEDEDDSDDDIGAGLGEDAIDLAAMLDDNDDAVLGDKHHTLKEIREENTSDEGDESQLSGSEEEEEEEEDDHDHDDDDDEDGSAPEERVARVMDRLETLDASRRPRQFASIRPPDDLTLEDLLAGIDGESRKRFEGQSKTKKSGKSVAIAAPLPKRQQDRLDREVATQKAKEQLDRWRDTVVRNRRAEFLSFPVIQADERSRVLGKEKFIPADQAAQRTELEESIQRIMEESGLSTKDHGNTSQDLGGEEAALLKSEELATNKLPIDEVMRRRGELRKARELLFREEIKAKRIAKIKSKSYRRVHRKERERLAEQERLALEGLGGEELMDKDETEKLERRRAEARVATKHKDSKWAKTLKATNRTVWDENARDSVIDQVKRNEDLKKRIAGKGVSDDSSSDNSENNDENEEDAQGVLQRLKSYKEDRQISEKGLSGLKFMRAAEERRRKANDEDVESLRKELAIETGDDNEGEDIEDGGLGRAVFGPHSKQSDTNAFAKERRLEFEAPDTSDVEGEEPSNGRKNSLNQQSELSNDKPKGILKDAKKVARPLAKTVHGNDRNLRTGQSQDEITTSDWLSKHGKGSKRQKQMPNEELNLNLKPKLSTADLPNIEMQQLSTVKLDTEPGGKANMNTDGSITATHHGERRDDTESEEPSDPILSKQEQRKALQLRAFAGDDVQIAFDGEKADIAESEDEKEVSNHLPGWGSWTGEGLSRSIRKANQRARHNPLFKSKVDGVRRADRKDANLDNVIISEKQDRKGKKYMAPILPHGFETKAQYERSRRLPMGPEWSTKEVHQHMTKPRVIVRPGVRLEALERPLI